MPMAVVLYSLPLTHSLVLFRRSFLHRFCLVFPTAFPTTMWVLSGPRVVLVTADALAFTVVAIIILKAERLTVDSLFRLPLCMSKCYFFLLLFERRIPALDTH